MDVCCGLLFAVNQGPFDTQGKNLVLMPLVIPKHVNCKLSSELASVFFTQLTTQLFLNQIAPL